MINGFVRNEYASRASGSTRSVSYKAPTNHSKLIWAIQYFFPIFDLIEGIIIFSKKYAESPQVVFQVS